MELGEEAIVVNLILQLLRVTKPSIEQKSKISFCNIKKDSESDTKMVLKNFIKFKHSQIV